MPYEIFNGREFGWNEGGQNGTTWVLTAATLTTLVAIEGLMQLRRILARGDTCSACDAAREHYRARIQQFEKGLEEEKQRAALAKK
jgi:hypothetical protein